MNPPCVCKPSQFCTGNRLDHLHVRLYVSCVVVLVLVCEHKHVVVHLHILTHTPAMAQVQDRIVSITFAQDGGIARVAFLDKEALLEGVSNMDRTSAHSLRKQKAVGGAKKPQQRMSQVGMELQCDPCSTHTWCRSLVYR